MRDEGEKKIIANFLNSIFTLINPSPIQQVSLISLAFKSQFLTRKEE